MPVDDEEYLERLAAGEQQLQQKVCELEPELKRLRAENERLTTAIRTFVAGMDADGMASFEELRSALAAERKPDAQ